MGTKLMNQETKYFQQNLSYQIWANDKYVSMLFNIR